MFKRVLIANRGRDRDPHRPGRGGARRRVGRRLRAGRLAVAAHPADDGRRARSAGDRGARRISTVERWSSRRPRQAAATAFIPATASCRRTPRFAERCAAEGLAFIGPRPTALAAVRRQGRRRARSRGRWAFRSCRAAPTRWPRRDDADGAAPRRIGYPVMLKASAGGGGRGMRAVDAAGGDGRGVRALPERGEAAFGDGRSSSRSWSRGRGTSRCRCWPTRQGKVVHLLRARLLGAAAQPEGRRDRAGAGARRRPARAHPARMPCRWRGRPAT